MFKVFSVFSIVKPNRLTSQAASFEATTRQSYPGLRIE